MTHFAWVYLLSIRFILFSDKYLTHNFACSIQKKTLFAFLTSEKKELRMSYYNTRFAIASNSGRWHPVLHIVTVASTILSVQKSQMAYLLYMSELTCLNNPPPPLFFLLFRRIRFSSIHSLGILFKSKIRHARK